jgi:hypothetical protein
MLGLGPLPYNPNVVSSYEIVAHIAHRSILRAGSPNVNKKNLPIARVHLRWERRNMQIVYLTAEIAHGAEKDLTDHSAISAVRDLFFLGEPTRKTE